jgi:hypothetical protein
LYEQEEKLNSITDTSSIFGFGFHVWSKERFDERLQTPELMTKFKKRFSKNLPLKYINLVFIEGLEDP